MVQVFSCEFYEVFKYILLQNTFGNMLRESVNWNLIASIVSIIYKELSTSSLISLLMVVKYLLTFSTVWLCNSGVEDILEATSQIFFNNYSGS